MTQQLSVLNGKEIKQLIAQLHEQYGFDGKIDAAFLRNEKKEKLIIFTKDIAEFDISKLRVDTKGLYFGAFYKGKIRLTIEGTQMIGPQCTKNVVEVSPWEMQVWLAGMKLKLPQLEIAQKEEFENGAFVILRCGNDYLGAGKIAGELILNYTPKTRHIHALYEVYDENGAVVEAPVAGEGADAPPDDADDGVGENNED